MQKPRRGTASSGFFAFGGDGLVAAGLWRFRCLQPVLQRLIRPGLGLVTDKDARLGCGDLAAPFLRCDGFLRLAHPVGHRTVFGARLAKQRFGKRCVVAFVLAIESGAAGAENRSVTDWM